MAESTQDSLTRNNPPRVHITLDVDTNGAIVKKELMFPIAILSDLSGHRDSDNPLPPLKNRKFVEIDAESFNKFLRSISPRLAFSVKDTLGDGDRLLNVELRFESIEDFEPENVAMQVPSLAKLCAERQLLDGLLTKLDGNDTLETLLQQLAGDRPALTQIQAQLNPGQPEGDDENDR